MAYDSFRTLPRSMNTLLCLGNGGPKAGWKHEFWVITCDIIDSWISSAPAKHIHFVPRFRAVFSKGHWVYWHDRSRAETEWQICVSHLTHCTESQFFSVKRIDFLCTNKSLHRKLRRNVGWWSRTRPPLKKLPLPVISRVITPFPGVITPVTSSYQINYDTIFIRAPSLHLQQS